MTKEGIYIVDRAGLLFRDKGTGLQRRLLTNNNFTSARRLADGRFLFTGAGGIYLYDTAHGLEFIPIKTEGAKTIQWKSCAEAKDGTVFLSALNSGTICKLTLATHKYELMTFQDNPVACLFIDASQNLWVGTDGNGVFRLDIKPPNFSGYTPALLADKEASFMVKSIFRDTSGIWMGTFNRGLIIYNPSLGRQRQIPLPFTTDAVSVTAILRDSSGYLVVTCGSRIAWLNTSSGTVVRQVSLPLLLRSSPESPVIYTLIEWKKDRFLAGTNMGLYSVCFSKDKPGGVISRVTQTNPQFTSHVYNLVKEKDGTIDVGKRGGYSKVVMVSDSFINVLYDGFGHIPVRHFYHSTTSPVLWMATEKGLIAWNDRAGRYKVFDEAAGLANSYVYAILAQNDSLLWISTNKGLSLVHAHYGDGINITAQFTNYTAKDGLQSNEFNTGAYYRDDEGNFYFGGIAGINWFRPEQVKPNPYPAQPVIADIYINDTLFARDSACWINTLTLPYSGNTVGLTFRALEYTRPEQNLFTYKLDGLDKDWVTTANDKVRYSNLPPGTYTFQLKVSNNEGRWNEKPLKLQITVLPPYWQTWWFRMLVLAVVVLVVYAIARSYVLQKVRAKTRELEKQQALYLERMRISKDVHDDLGSGLSKISLMAELAQTRASTDASLGNDIRHISAVSKELVDNMRDLIWVLNPENTTLEQLVSRLREYCADYLESMPLTVSLDFPDSVPPMRISHEAQRNIFLTAKEAINNCIKHAHATHIVILLRVCEGILTIEVTDNGTGFKSAILKSSGNGLRNMKQRIELIGGRFMINSAAGGTRVIMTLPLAGLSVEKIPL